MEIISLNGKQRELYQYVDSAGPDGIKNDEFIAMVRRLDLSLYECEAINESDIFEFDRYPNGIRVRAKVRNVLN